MEINQFSVVFVNTGTASGSEISGKRPFVIISPNEMNSTLGTVIIAPLTNQSKDYPTRIAIRHNNKDAWLVLDQVHTIDKQRIHKIHDHLSKKEIAKIKTVLKEIFVD